MLSPAPYLYLNHHKVLGQAEKSKHKQELQVQGFEWKPYDVWKSKQ